MKLRSGRRRPETSIEELLRAFDETRPIDPRVDSASRGREDGARARRDEAPVRAAIARLPENYRAVLLLRDIEEVSTAGRRRMLGLTPNAVKIRCTARDRRCDGAGPGPRENASSSVG
jgi:DNA-directed RNA polymerase specialized sigma24 family protein